MLETDFDEFQQVLDAICSMLSRGNYQPNPISTSIFFKALKHHDMPTVREAFQAHVQDPQRGRFAPTPADIIAQIEGMACADGRPDEEEAWATGLRSYDEATTVVWTEEIAQAMGEVRAILAMGDKVGARMSFKSIYARLVDDARRERRAVKWSASIGTDVQARNAVLLQHVQAGRLSSDVLQIETAPATLLIEHAEKGVMPEYVREQIIALREMLARPKADAPSKDAIAKQQTAEAKAMAGEAIKNFEGGNGNGL